MRVYPKLEITPIQSTMPPEVNRVPENRIPTGISVYDAETGGNYPRMIVVNHTGKPSNEVELDDSEGTVADTNPEYDPKAPVVQAVFRDELKEHVDGWKWMPVTDLASAAKDAGITFYSYPAPRLKSTASPVPERVETYRELICYESARLVHLAATIEHPEKFQEPQLWINYNKRIDGEVSASPILKENKYQLKENTGVCTYCNQEAETTFDHIIPSDNGGSDKIRNMVPACQSCNSSKSNQNVIDWHQTHSIPIDRVVLGKYLKLRWEDFEDQDRLGETVPDTIRARWDGLEVTRRINNRIWNNCESA